MGGHGEAHRGSRVRGKTRSLLACLLLLLGTACSEEGPSGIPLPSFAPGWSPTIRTGPAPDRSRWAEVEASSARFGPPPYPGTSLLDLLPLTWPHLLPSFASDGSLLTRWASEEGGCPYLVLTLAPPSAPALRVDRVVLHWADEVPGRWRLESAVGDGAWASRELEGPLPGSVQELRLDPPMACHRLRIHASTCPVPAGMSIRTLQIYPARDDRLPTPVRRLHGEPMGLHALRLTWEPVAGAFLYRVYRSLDPWASPDDAQWIGSTRETFFDSRLPTDAVGCAYRVVPETFSGNRGGAVDGFTITPDRSAPPSPFATRGVVEGFYNQPWSHPDRLALIRFLGANGLNFYLYAPKVEGLHRAHWREPYPPGEMNLFAELVLTARRHGVQFCYGLSPGLDYRWDDPGEADRILGKFEAFHAIGVRAFCVLFDDTPDTSRSDAALAERHVALVRLLLERLLALSAEPVTFLFVPTIYFKTVSELRRTNPAFVAYLEGLASLPPEVQVCWVGPGMPYSPEILLAQAEEVAEVLNRKVVIWDNYPTTDNFFLFEPFLGPYRNRDPELPGAVSGILSNPMNYPNLSRVPLFTLARYLDDPADYRPEEAFDEAIRRVGGNRGGRPLRTLAMQFYGHPILPPTHLESPELREDLDAFWGAYDAPRYPAQEADVLAQAFGRFVRLPADVDRYIPHAPLRGELRGPARKLALLGRAGQTALQILEALHQGNTGDLERLLVGLEREMGEADALPWRAGENRLDALPAFIFGSPVVEVDVIGGFLRRVRSLARTAASSPVTGVETGLDARPTTPRE